MGRIIQYNDVLALENLSTGYAKMVVAGGCFDILHVGHILFLERARAEGDGLVILLESDQRIRTIKGEGRPINTQHNRAIVLSALRFVDMVIMLPEAFSDHGYDELISAIKPAIIATTSGDPFRHHKDRQANLIGGIVKEVVERIPEHSTSATVTKLEEV